MAMLADMLKAFLREAGSNSSADNGVRDPSEFGGSTADSGVLKPDTMMDSKQINSDKSNITNDAGSIVGQDFGETLKQLLGPSPQKTIADPTGDQGTIRGMLRSMLGTRGDGNDANKLVPGTGTVGGGEPDHVPGTGQDAALNPEPMAKQRQGKFADNGKVLPPLEPGNIDLSTRPQHVNDDGTISTVRSKSFNFNGKEVLLPTISDNGMPMSDQEAIENYKQTGKHLGVYSNPASADAYGKIIHNQQASMLKYAQPTALDPTAIEQLRQSLLGQAGQNDPSNPNGLAGRMTGPNSKVDMQQQKDQTIEHSSTFRKDKRAGDYLGDYNTMSPEDKASMNDSWEQARPFKGDPKAFMDPLSKDSEGMSKSDPNDPAGIKMMLIRKRKQEPLVG